MQRRFQKQLKKRKVPLEEYSVSGAQYLLLVLQSALLQLHLLTKVMCGGATEDGSKYYDLVVGSGSVVAAGKKVKVRHFGIYLKVRSMSRHLCRD